MTDSTQPIPVTADGIRQWGPWFAGIALFLVSATATVVLAYFSLKASIAAQEIRIAAVEARISSEVGKRDELLARMKNVEKFLAGLVCKQTPAECPQAMALIGQ